MPKPRWPNCCARESKMILTFGAYKGKDHSELDTEYLHWIASAIRRNPELLRAVKKTLYKRLRDEFEPRRPTLPCAFPFRVQSVAEFCADNPAADLV